MFIQDPSTDTSGEVFLPFECERIPERFLEKAIVELNDTPERRIEGLREIKERINNDQHTKHLEFEDGFLLQFLRGKKYDVSKAFSFLKAIVHFKKKNMEVFTGFSYKEMLPIMSENVIRILPWRCQDGCTIIVSHLDNWDPERLSLKDIKRAITIFLLQTLRELMTQINGFKIIMYVKSNPIKHLRYITPTNLYLLYHGTQDCVPARYKEIHIVNESLALKTAWVLMKPFFTDKIKKRIHFHSSNEGLLKFFPKSILPLDFGGDLQNYEMYEWLAKVTEPEKIAVLGGCPRQT